MTLVDRVRRLVTAKPAQARQGPCVAFLHPGRCGSTVLGTMLGDRPDTVWDGELFESRRSARVPEFAAGMAPANVVEERRRQAEGKAYVFAIKYLSAHHLRVFGGNLDGLVECLDAAGVDHVVAIRRRNHLRRIVSGEVGRSRGTYHQRAEDGPAELVMVNLDPGAVALGPRKPLLQAFRELDDEEGALRATLSGRSHVWLDFEDDIEDDPGVGYRKVCAFIGLPDVEVDVRLTRTTPFPLDQVLENYDEIMQLLAGTPYAWMLEDN